MEILVTIFVVETANVIFAALSDNKGDNFKWGMTSLFILVIGVLLCIGGSIFGGK